MGKKNKRKVKRLEAEAAAVQSAGDFDDMLVEFRAADLTTAAATTITTTTTTTTTTITTTTTTTISNSSLINSSSTPNATRMEQMRVSEDMIIDECDRENVAQLRHWGRQGVRVQSARSLAYAVAWCTPDVTRCLVKNLGANVNQAKEYGYPPLFIAARHGRLAALRCLVKDLGANVITCFMDRTHLYFATENGQLAAVQCLVKELSADIDKAADQGLRWCTPLMMASYKKHADVVRWLIKEGANTQACAYKENEFGIFAVTAADLSKRTGASSEQTAYLEAKTHCSNPGCSGAGIKRCPACKQARYCGEPCQYAHWKAHKADSKRWSAELNAAGKGTGARGK
jgi:hypothetical protein